MIPSLRLYFGHPAVIPSLSLSLLYLTVLSFNGQMLAYLLASNINLWQVGIIRGVSTIFELSATWIAPRLMKRIGVIRTGLWSISWQMAWLAGAVSWFFYYYGRGYLPTDLLPAAGLTVAVAFSRIGLWGFDLSAQNIVQDVCSPPLTCVYPAGAN
jgi:iron-regulated transporter 1